MKKHIYLLLFCWFWGLACYGQTPQKMTYVYDALNRLAEVTYPDGSKITYNYDVLGNRTSVVTVSSCVLPTAIISGGGTIIAGSGQTAPLYVTFTGLPPYDYTLSDGYVGFSYSTTQTLTVSPATTRTYTLTSVSNSCGTGTVSGSAVVTVNACTQMYTLKTGNWNDVTVWSCGRVPTSTDIVTVKLNNFITIPASYTANAKNVVFEAIGGKFIYTANTSKLCLSCP